MRKFYYLFFIAALALPATYIAAMERPPTNDSYATIDSLQFSPAYRALEELLFDYKRLAEKGGWPVFTPGEKIEPGVSNTQIPTLRAILLAAGDLTEKHGEQPELYDETLVAAVQSFQRRHGLTDDGVIGKETQLALATPIEFRIKQIEATLARIREFNPTEERFLLVNLPEFMLRGFSHGKLEAEMKVIVGTPKNATPIFSRLMTYVSFNPHWGVPSRIAAEEMLPKIIENPNFFAEQDFALYEVVGEERVEIDPATVDWSQFGKDHFPYLMRQRPGKGNALGKIKFGLKNSNDIYMHDTSNPKLFAKDIRAFSHGCIRVENPYELAKFVFETKENFSPERMDALYNGTESRIITIPTLPVHIVYWTAWVDASGKANFRKDIYGLDRR